MDSLSFIIGILFAVPLSIVANLLTPRVALWWARRSEAIPRKRLARIDFELKRITHVDDNPIDVLAQVVSIVAQFVAGLGFCGMTAAAAIITSSDQVRLSQVAKISGFSPKLFLYSSAIIFFITLLSFVFWVSVRMDISTPLSLLTRDKRDDLRYQLTCERNNIIKKYPELLATVDNSALKSETSTKLLS
jgi:hypothetical protein